MPYKLKQTYSEERILRQNGYKLLEQLSEGGYAKVFLGEFKTPNGKKTLQLACKIINTHTLTRRVVMKFLPRELKCLIKLKHPYIIQVHSIFYRKSKYFIFMRHGEKGDLLEYIKHFGVVEQNQSRIWVRQIALAVQYMHILEIAHRDLKCENILITVHNNVKLSDFGFSRSVLGSNNKKELSMTFCGSVSYVAPEVLKGEAYDAKIADIWSLGVIIYTMVNGSYPFDSKNLKVLYQNQVDNRWKFRSKYVDTLSRELKDLISCLLEPDINKRYKIEEVIKSDWIAMDSRLKSLNQQEYAALSAAIEEAKSFGYPEEPYEGSRIARFSSAMRKVHLNKSNVVFFKEYRETYDAQLLLSVYSTPKLLP